MNTFVALLRSINVGGRNRLPMAHLAGLVSELGFGDVETYLQSGNVVFRGSGPAAEIGRAIEARITADLGLDVSVIVRTKSQLARTIEANLRAPEVFVHPFRLIPYTRSGVFVHPWRRLRSADVT